MSVDTEFPSSVSFDDLQELEWVEYSALTPDAPKLYYNPITKELRTEGDFLDEEKNERQQEKQESRTEFVLNAVENVCRDMNRVLGRAQHLSMTICDNARLILRAAESIGEELLQGGEKAVDERNDVQFLVDFTKLRWKFHQNATVDRYRLSTESFDHRSYQFQDWHLPKYLAETMPIRKDADGSGRAGAHPTNGYQIRVVLPIQDADGQESEASLRILPQDSAKKVITESHAKAKVSLSFVDADIDLGISDEYVLKAYGASDFMEGDVPLLHFEYVRQQLRDNHAIVLYLVRRPEPSIIENEGRYAVLYKDQRERSRAAQRALQQRLVQELRPADPRSVTLLPPVLESTEFQDLDAGATGWKDLRYISALELHVPFRFEFVGLENCVSQAFPLLSTEAPQPHVFMQSFVFYGMNKLRATCWSSTPKLWGPNMVWRQQMCGPARETLVSQMPREARLGLILYAQSTPAEEPVRLGWAVRPLVDDSGLFLQGPQTLNLWPFENKYRKHGKKQPFDPDFIYRATTRDNQMPGACCQVQLRFPTFEAPVVAPLTLKYRAPDLAVVGRPVPLDSLSMEQVRHLDSLIGSDPLHKLTSADRRIIWRMRHHLVRHPQILPKFLQCVDWGNVEHKLEAHRLLRDWSPPDNVVTALELLDVKYADYRVREYAVGILRRIDDYQLSPYLLQLAQCLKFEPYHNNPLTRFLLARGLANPLVIGHFIFWNLKSELHEPAFCERFGLILEEYLAHSGRHAIELRKQSMMTIKFADIAERVVRMKRQDFGDEDVKSRLHEDLERLNRDFFVPMKKFQVPYDPKLEATTLIVEKCRFMASKMVPLWLVFKNADPQGQPIMFIFKSGDDLRQDILTLQLLTIMDRIWLGAGIDMRMKPYKVVSTGVNANNDGVGLIQIVPDSNTTSGIQQKYGGGAMGALKLEPLDDFVREHNASPQQYNDAVDNFVRSCAGYCVATFVMGVGDRHNGNIMISKDGHLFHIDFGHFLGNFKKKFGVNRERAAFVFTPEMAYVMGGKDYSKSPHFKHFLEMCYKGYHILRQNALVLENLFVLMIAAGMPELLREDDIGYLRNMLHLDQTKKVAETTLHDEIRKSLSTRYRRFDNAIHIWKNNG